LRWNRGWGEKAEEGWEGLEHSLSQLGGWTLSTTGGLWSVVHEARFPIVVVMADALFWRRTAAPPLHGYPIVGRVLMKHLPQFEGWRCRCCWVQYRGHHGGDLQGDCHGVKEAKSQLSGRPVVSCHNLSQNIMTCRKICRNFLRRDVWDEQHIPCDERHVACDL
jgi:hypothetical protein